MRNRSPDDRHGWRSDLRLRLAGVFLLACSGLAVRGLIALHAQHLHSPSGPLALGLAGVGFIAASLGAALVSLGHHVFDEVEVSRRWARVSPQPDAARATPQPDDAARLSAAQACPWITLPNTGSRPSIFNLMVFGQVAR